MGSAVGAAAFGAIANATLVHKYASAPADLPVSGKGVDATTRYLATPGPVADFARSALYSASHNVFVALAVATAVTAGAIALIPRQTTELEFPD
jgi:hypothetical protein